MDGITDVSAWHPLARVLGVLLGGTSFITFAGLVADKLWPSANRRLDDAKDRRIEDDQRIARLEEALEEMTKKWLAAERQVHAKERETWERDAQLLMLRSKLGMPVVLMTLLAFLPFLIDAAIQLYAAGELRIPDQYKAIWVVLVLAWQGYAKVSKEQERQHDAQVLTRQGLPMGEPLPPRAVERALFTETTLPEAHAAATGVPRVAA
ncbi:MAG: hypothetical protein AVDCRST_MAG77-2142 [uncultured Chloroflexi bacterium]|uniref:Holin of 3TMs, for gene-transfer release n=1 Tax=uncultured Chloroflexota bacterium TaxID=166587 RepID=A0A6J4IJH2_9CHLR|nr:MAG: hypothetical protein AVDCRST_MAG77-2142 [uncultured Chloroflexota bacterium]